MNITTIPSKRLCIFQAEYVIKNPMPFIIIFNIVMFIFPLDFSHLYYYLFVLLSYITTIIRMIITYTTSKPGDLGVVSITNGFTS